MCVCYCSGSQPFQLCQLAAAAMRGYGFTLRPPLAQMDWFSMGHGPILGHGPGVRDPCVTESKRCFFFLRWHLICWIIQVTVLHKQNKSQSLIVSIGLLKLFIYQWDPQAVIIFICKSSEHPKEGEYFCIESYMSIVCIYLYSHPHNRHMHLSIVRSTANVALKTFLHLSSSTIITQYNQQFCTSHSYSDF